MTCTLGSPGPCGDWHCPTHDLTSNPITYATGQIAHGEADIADPFGGWLSVRRSYDNLSSSDYDGPSGWNWFTDRVPYVLREDGVDDDAIIVSATPGNSIYFDLVSTTYVPRFPLAGRQQTLSHDPTAHTFTYREVSGDGKVQTWVFQDTTQSTYTPGIFESHTDAYGVKTEVMSYYNGTIGSMRRVTTSGGVDTIYTLDYLYYTSGATGKIRSATLTKKVGAGATTVVRKATYTYHAGTQLDEGSANDLKTVMVQDGSSGTIDTTYYRYWAPRTVTFASSGTTATASSGAVPHGLAVNDEVTVTGASDGEFNGTFTVATTPSSTSFTYTMAAVPANAIPTGTIKAIDARGFGHGLKHIVGPASYARLVAANIGNPTIDGEVTDAEVLPYADNYFEYDGRRVRPDVDDEDGDSNVTELVDNRFFRAVTKEIAQGAGCSCAGGSGQGEFTYERHVNPRNVGSDYNKWKYKTIETLPDGNTNTVYGNYARGTILKVFTDSTTESWGWFYKRNARGLVTLEAQPSALNLPGVISNMDQYDDLLNEFVGGDYGYMRDSEGLIKIYDYATATTATTSVAGDVEDYLKAQKVQHGETGSPITVSATTYIKHVADLTTASDGLGAIIYPVASETRYRNDNGTGGMTTSHAYTWYTAAGSLATTAIKSVTTTAPPIVAAQNGPASSTTDYANADVTVTFFDAFGRVQWTKDGDGYITYTAYDDATGAVVKQITDVDTTQTADFANLPGGWTTPTDPSTRVKHLISTMEVDSLGRTTKATDPEGSITYTVYKDADHEVRTYPGWQTGATTGPIQVSREHRPATTPSGDRAYTESLTTSATPTVDGGVPTGAETISAANIQSLSRSYLDKSNRVVETNVYHSLSGMTYYPDAGTGRIGTAGTNYYATTVGFDEMGRRDKSVDALGTITRTGYDTMGRVSSVWVGTDDTGWTASTGGGDMVKVLSNVYDGGAMGANGLITQSTQYVDGTSGHDRVTKNYYDWRDRLVASKAGVQGSEDSTTHRPIVYRELDNLGRATVQEQYDGDTVTVTSTSGVPNRPSSGLLRAKSVTSFDDQGRVYRTATYGVDPSAGTVSSDALTSNTWYDHRGQAIKSAAPGGVVSKRLYDGAGRVLTSYTTDGGGDSAWTDADDVTGDKVLTESTSTYDKCGNVLLSVSKQRLNDTTATGALGDLATNPKAWVSYAAMYYDAADRLTDSVSVGTNGGSAYSRPGSVPSRSDTVLVTTVHYDAAGRVDLTTDPKAIVTKKLYDLMGRTKSTVEAYDAAVNSGDPTDAANRTTRYTYDGNSNVATLTADMPSGTNDQVTQYVYGVVAAGGNDVTSNSLLKEVRYPDRTAGTAGTTSADKQVFTYNRLGQNTTLTDQNGTVRTFAYDVLGRRVSDAVAVAGGNPQNVDQTVLRQQVSFDTGGRPYELTSYDAASSGNVVNQVRMVYNGLGQLTGEYQSHGGAVDTGNDLTDTPKVGYTYTEMASSANHSRLTKLAYPDRPNGSSRTAGRELFYSYDDAGDSAGLSASISRVTALSDASTRGSSDVNVIAGYDWMGTGTAVRKDYPTPDVRLDLWGGTTGTYAGLDRFGRVTSQRWHDYGASADVFKVDHGYDRDSNRLYADNATQAGASQAYGYDLLNRLTTYERGLNNSSTKAIETWWIAGSLAWALDALGNQKTVADDGTASYHQNTPNDINEYTTRAVRGDLAKAPVYADAFGTNTASLYAKPGSGDAFDVNSTNAGKLTVTTVSDDTIDTYSEPGAQAILLMGTSVGPMQGEVTVNIPSGGAAGQAGFVFGYKSGADYWLKVQDASDGKMKIYRVTNGTKTLLASYTAAYTAGTDVVVNQISKRRSVIYTAYDIADGFPSGRWGLYTTKANTKFDDLKVWNDAEFRDLGTRWLSTIGDTAGASDIGAINKSTDRLRLQADPTTINHPVFLKNLRLRRFQLQFAMHREQAGEGRTCVVFNATEQDGFDQLRIDHSNTKVAPFGRSAPDGEASYAIGGETRDSTKMPTLTQTSVLWVRIQCDGSTFKVLCQAGASEPSDGSWNEGTQKVYQTTNFTNRGGMIGFKGDLEGTSVDDVTVKSDTDGNGTYETTERVEPFTADGGGLVQETLAHDNNGNLTFDGNQRYTYDAWNRLVKVAHAYRDSGGTVQVGHAFDVMGYDAKGRRVTKATTNTGQWDCTYHYYYDGQRQIEARNGSNQAIKQHVWGITYVDELIQVANNSDPTADNTCELKYWACQDANFNVLGLTDSTGVLVERYEYTPYGQRTAFHSPGANDPALLSPLLTSRRVTSGGGTVQPYALCDVGHQGLHHDEDNGLVYNRARYLHATLGRFMQRDPNGTVDGSNLYTYVRSRPITLRDHRGTESDDVPPTQASQACANSGWNSLQPKDCKYGNIFYSADFVMFDTDRSKNCCKCEPHIMQRFGSSGPCTARVAWPIDCVCKNMPDDPYANCVRGCLRCIFDNNGGQAQNQEEHEWCFNKCGGLADKFSLLQKLDKGIHCCAMKQGIVLGPGRGTAPGAHPQNPRAREVDCNGCGGGPRRTLDCSGY